jgi:hypothetical protein
VRLGWDLWALPGETEPVMFQTHPAVFLSVYTQLFINKNAILLYLFWLNSPKVVRERKLSSPTGLHP